MKSELHQKLQDKGLQYLRNKTYWVSEREISIGWIIDVWGLSPSRNYECSAIEVKVSRSDFFSKSQKDKNIHPSSIANTCYILCPQGLIQIEDVHDDWGLLWYNEKTDRIINKKMPVRQEMTDRMKLVALTNFLWSGINHPKRLEIIEDKNSQ